MASAAIIALESYVWKGVKQMEIASKLNHFSDADINRLSCSSKRSTLAKSLRTKDRKHCRNFGHSRMGSPKLEFLCSPCSSHTLLFRASNKERSNFCRYEFYPCDYSEFFKWLARVVIRQRTTRSIFKFVPVPVRVSLAYSLSNLLQTLLSSFEIVPCQASRICNKQA